MKQRFFNLRLNHYLLSTVLAVLLLLVFCVINIWMFGWVLNTSYFSWYISTGPVIALVTTLAAVVWDGFDKDPGFISKNPYAYIAPYFGIAALIMYSLATIIDPKNHAKRPSLLDSILGLIFMLVLMVAIFVWLLVVVPFQYFVFLICGAIPRLSLNASTQLVAGFAGTQLFVDEQAKNEPVSDGRWVVMMTDQPFKITSAFSVAFLFLVKQILEMVGS